MRVVVAGTAFGRIYLDAVAADPELVLAGILGRGSSTTLRLAEHYGVPALASTADIGDDIDIVCVVIGSAVNGGPGAEIAERLLRRGIHVLQEHPLHPDEISRCQRAAREGGAVHHVGTLYPDLAPVRTLLAAAQHLRKQQPVLFVDAACSVQLLYPLLDVLGRALGGARPWSFSPPAAVPPAVARSTRTAQPFQMLHAAVAGVPVALRVQNQISPTDRDNHGLLTQRLAIGFEAGVLTLADPFGPVLWNQRMFAPRDSSGRLALDGPPSAHLDAVSTRQLGEQDAAPHTYRSIFTSMWPEAVREALGRLRKEMGAPASQRTTAQWGMAVSRMWADLTSVLGPPEITQSLPPRPASPM